MVSRDIGHVPKPSPRRQPGFNPFRAAQSCTPAARATGMGGSVRWHHPHRQYRRSRGSPIPGNRCAVTRCCLGAGTAFPLRRQSAMIACTTMSQRISGFRSRTRRAISNSTWPVLALLYHLPKPQCAWDPCDRGNGMLIDTLLAVRSMPYGTEHDFLSINEPPFEADAMITTHLTVKTAAVSSRSLSSNML